MLGAKGASTNAWSRIHHTAGVRFGFPLASTKTLLTVAHSASSHAKPGDSHTKNSI